MTRRFTVTWRKSVEQEVTNAWLQVTDRREFSRLIDDLEQQLADSPELAGEEFHEGLRRVVVADCLIYFVVTTADCMVEVVRFRRRA